MAKIVTYPNKPKGINTIGEAFGGVTCRVGLLSRRWQISGYAAVSFARIIEPHAPSRRETITAFLEWENSENYEERRQIALGSRHTNRYSVVTAGDYSNLAADPQFTAGVVDGRGTFIGSTRPELNIKSKNGALLGALHQKYGGYFGLSSEPGDTKEIEDRTMIVRDNSYVLKLYTGNLLYLLRIVDFCLLLRKDEAKKYLTT